MAAPKKKRRIRVPKGKKLIFRPWITDRNGKVIFAWQCGIRAFPMLVDA